MNKNLVGKKVRVKKVDGKSNVKQYKDGVITEVTKACIFVKYENYSESFNLAAIIAPDSESISIRLNKEWIPLRRVIDHGQAGS